jgi:UDP-2-acetamido-2-deoxy-ribo-hexuluronate aminotransferase
MNASDLREEQMKIVDQVDGETKQASGQGCSGCAPEARELEEKLAGYCGVKHAVSCSSVAKALLMALESYGVGPGDAVFTTPFTDNTAVSAIRVLGATPVFVDIDQSTFNLDPEQLEMAVEAVIKRDRSIYPLPAGAAANLSPKGIISVDLFGLPADYDAINAIAGNHNLFVIEDGAHAFGGVYKGRRVGSLADIGCVSFSPEAPLGSDGSGGMCFTDSDHLAERMRSIRMQGEGRQAGNRVVECMDSLKAAALLAKFAILPEEIGLRREIAKLYTKYLDENPLLVTPYVPKDVLPVWSRYSLLTESDEERSTMIHQLEEASIPVSIYYAPPLYLQEALSDLQYREGDFPVSDDYATRIFSIPLHSYLASKDLEAVADLLNDWQ